MHDDTDISAGGRIEPTAFLMRCQNAILPMHYRQLPRARFLMLGRVETGSPAAAFAMRQLKLDPGQGLKISPCCWGCDG